MKRTNLLMLILAIIVAMSLAACGPKPTTAEIIPPSTLEKIEGSDLQKVMLTEKAAERIGVQTVPAEAMVVPYSAVIYDIDGTTWIYTNPESLTFVRAQVVIDRIEGDQAFLAQELETDAPVVTVGVMEIYGAETGVSK